MRHAYQGLGLPSEEKHDEYQRLILIYQKYLEHNELELALDTLEELGHFVLCQGSFWRNLERAATNMKLPDRTSKLHEKFLETLKKTI